MSSYLEVNGLVKRFTSGSSFRRGESITAVDNVSFALNREGSLGVVGESGSGKTTTARMLARLVDPDEGSVFLDGVNLTHLDRRQLRDVARRVQIVFQDPGSSLNPRWRIGRLVAEGLNIHRIGSATDRQTRSAEMLERCGIPPAAASRYPHEFSGGQRQRIAIARALAIYPELVILDEPVSALDVSIQAQILELLKQLQVDMGLTYVLISHDLAVVSAFCDSIVVMSQGQIVERGQSSSIFQSPKDPYTKMLIAAHPNLPSSDERADKIKRRRVHDCDQGTQPSI